MAAAAARKATPKKAAAESWRVGKRSGLYKATFSITREQFEALKAAAAAQRPDAIRSDVSAVLRDILDAWMNRRA